METTKKEITFRGIPVSSGMAMGEAELFSNELGEIISISLPPEDVEAEIERYNQAVKEVKKYFLDSERLIKQEIGEEEASLFSFYKEVLDDPSFRNGIPKLIREKRLNAEAVLLDSMRRFDNGFALIEEKSFKEKNLDFRDVFKHLIHHLLNIHSRCLFFPKKVVIVAHELTASDLIHMDREKILAIVTEVGGSTSHAAILARSLGIPAVMGVSQITKVVKKGETILVNGDTGEAILNPNESAIKRFNIVYKRKKKENEELSKVITYPSVTLDGESFKLMANIANIYDAKKAKSMAANGIGLFRTEMPFLVQERMLTEEEQFLHYKDIVKLFGRKYEVVIRTLDIGGDKFLPFQEIAHEMNPFMGWRSIRISLKEKNHFIKQIKAILRTSAIGKVKILFPMVSSIDEFREAKKLVERAKKELQKEGKAFDPNIQLGIMVEVPSIGVMANLIIKEVDFLSIGSNDLIQFMLAVDRNNEKVAPFYQPLNPAVIHIIHEVIKAGIKAKKPVSLCGEMAGESFYAPLLFGLGLRVFSMNPHSIPKVKKVLISLKTGETQELAEEALKKTTHEEIYNLLEKFNRIRRIN